MSNERFVHWVSASKDPKTGNVPVSYSPKDSCPDSCSLKQGGCYAWGLFYLNILGGKIKNKRITLKALKTALKERRADARIVRHRVAGDVVGDVEQTVQECLEVEQAGLTNIGYTHHWRAEESQPLKQWFRASCQSLKEVGEARSMGWSVALMVPEETPRTLVMFNGEKAFVCPARHGVVNKKDITCNDCTLCKVDVKTQDKGVMFRIHGSKKTISLAADQIESI